MPVTPKLEEWVTWATAVDRALPARLTPPATGAEQDVVASSIWCQE